MNKSVVALVTVGMLASCGSSWRFWEDDKNENQKVDLTKRAPQLNSQGQGQFSPQAMIDAPQSPQPAPQMQPSPQTVSDYPGYNPSRSTDINANSQSQVGQQAVTEVSAPVNLGAKRAPAFNGEAMAEAPPVPVVGVMNSPLAPSFGQPVAVTATQEFVPAPPPAPLPVPGVASAAPIPALASEPASTNPSTLKPIIVSTNVSELKPIAPLATPNAPIQISSAPLPPVSGGKEGYPMLAQVQESPKVKVDVKSDPRANELRSDFNSMQNQAKSINNGGSIVVTSNRNIPTPPPVPMAGTMVPPPPSMAANNAPSIPAPEYTPPPVTPQQIASASSQLLPSGPTVVVKSNKSGVASAKTTSYSSFPTPPAQVMAQNSPSTDVNVLRPLASPQVASSPATNVNSLRPLNTQVALAPTPATNVNSLRPLNTQVASAPNVYVPAPQPQPEYGQVALAPRPALLAPPKMVDPIRATPPVFDGNLDVGSMSPSAAPMHRAQGATRLLPESRYAKMRMRSRDEAVREYSQNNN